jgi:hypothetical protein
MATIGKVDSLVRSAALLTIGPTSPRLALAFSCPLNIIVAVAAIDAEALKTKLAKET